jgi:hypothetical protein
VGCRNKQEDSKKVLVEGKRGQDVAVFPRLRLESKGERYFSPFRGILFVMQRYGTFTFRGMLTRDCLDKIKNSVDIYDVVSP